MGYKNIKDQLVIILQSVPSLKSVYGKEPKALNDGGYPAAGISAMNDQESFESLGNGGSNKVIYNHVIRLYFRTNEANDPDYEDVLESVADDVKQALRSNIKLNNTCNYSLPVSGQWKDGQKESPLRVYEIIEQSTLLVDR